VGWKETMGGNVNNVQYKSILKYIYIYYISLIENVTMNPPLYNEYILIEKYNFKERFGNVPLRPLKGVFSKEGISKRR
jgi:hypothetical protein